MRNPASGSAAQVDWDEVTGTLGRAGAIEVLEPSSADSFRSEVRSSVRPDDLLVIAGGDGSLGMALDAVSDRTDDLMLGVLPVGTGNDFARGMGVPMDPVEAAGLIVSGDARGVDLCLASGTGAERHFVNACMGGFPVSVDESLEEATKSRLGPLAFWVGGAKAATDLDRYEVVVNEDRSPDVVAVGVGNGSNVGGGIPVFPEASPQDGSLDVCVMPAESIVDAARLALRVRKGEHVELPQVTVGRHVTVRIEASPPIAINVDGEVVGLESPATFEVVGKFRLRG